MNGRSTLQAKGNPRLSQNLSHIRKIQLSGTSSSDNVLTSLRATQIIASKPVLPAELTDMILDYVPVPDLMRFARVCSRFQEMVYDDTRWIQKLKAIGVWNEVEARQRVDDAMKRKMETDTAKGVDGARRMAAGGSTNTNAVTGSGRQHAGSITLFDANVEEHRYKTSLDRPQSRSHRRVGTVADGFEELTISPASELSTSAKSRDPQVALTILGQVRSVRGHARQEFAKVYAALGPLYNDLTSSQNHSNASIFRTYRDPEQQAQILSNLKRFAQSDTTQGGRHREANLDRTIGVFENAVLKEFEQGYAAGDVDGRMRRYAHVLATMNGGSAGMDTFISNNPIIARTVPADNPLDCLDGVATGHVDLNPSQRFFEKLARTMIEQAAIIDKVFPPSVDVLTPLLSRICNEIVSEYLTTLFDEAHNKGLETYVKAVSGAFEQSLRLVASLKPTQASSPTFTDDAKQLVTRCFEKHIDLYLVEELTVFKARSEAEVARWEKDLLDQETSAESFFMSNINRQAAKRDFLTSFKKVVMMPVNVLPTFPLSSPFAASKTAPIASGGSASNPPAVDWSEPASRSRTPTLSEVNNPHRSSTPQQQPPTTELAAKAAIMNSRLEGIKSLFSIETALNLTHFAKASLERAANMVRMGGKYGEDAREQCEAIFVLLLHILGDRHVKNGFDKAVGHLGNYNPREVRQLRVTAANNESLVAGETGRTAGVEPLVTFLELVNVGDLIQQMIDVFYAQELVATKLTDRDDFLDPAVKEKKRFEQMLDERVAAGLNKGIDVLIDEVEYICASTQVATDFNPGVDTQNGRAAVVDIGPSTTAMQVVDMVSGHTSMLVGSTDKNMLDVFTQEVGLRLFGALCKHFKRQRISADGAIKLIADINHYSAYIATLRQKPLVPYFQALRELGQIYLVHIDPPAAYFGANARGKRTSILSSKGSTTSAQAKELATIIADTQRYVGIFPAEEVYEFAERRADWYLVKGDVERAMYGVGCSLM